MLRKLRRAEVIAYKDHYVPARDSGRSGPLSPQGRRVPFSTRDRGRGRGEGRGHSRPLEGEFPLATRARDATRRTARERRYKSSHRTLLFCVIISCRSRINILFIRRSVTSHTRAFDGHTATDRYDRFFLYFFLFFVFLFAVICLRSVFG